MHVIVQPTFQSPTLPARILPLARESQKHPRPLRPAPIRSEGLESSCPDGHARCAGGEHRSAQVIGC
jgi:hypothetical protein